MTWRCRLVKSTVSESTIVIFFTPEEEVGRGADFFDVEGFNTDFAYTVDGGEIGELEYENFNASSVDIKIIGKSVHPGSAYNVMINAASVATEFNSMVPQNEVPEKTKGYETKTFIINLLRRMHFRLLLGR